MASTSRGKAATSNVDSGAGRGSASKAGRGRSKGSPDGRDPHVASEFEFAREVASATKCPSGFSMAQKERLGVIASAFALGRRLEAERLWRGFVMSSFASSADNRLDPTIAYVLHSSLELAPPDEADVQLEGARLQNVLQTHSQTLHMLTSLSRSMHDTAINVTRNIRGDGGKRAH